MSKTIMIDPVTRIEGHAKITLQLDDQGEVCEARFHVTQFRGFEKFCEGRPFYEMPSLMARICGICPVSHLLASAKACDALLAVRSSAIGRQAAPHAESRPDHAVARFEFFPSIVAGFAPRNGCRPDEAQFLRRDPQKSGARPRTEFACASSASK